MKSCLVMRRVQEFNNVHEFAGSKDWRLGPLSQVFSNKFEPAELIDWLYKEKKTSISTQCVSIRKEKGAIALYDVSMWIDETYTGEYLDPEKRFEMTLKNFAEIIFQWEQLRMSRLDIVLVIIHEDNHVSLETDTIIIQQYRDAGYDFNFDKK